MQRSRKSFILAIFVAGVWMNLNEFIRNEVVVGSLWRDGFQRIGLSFPSEPLNGAVWGVWVFGFCAVLAWLVPLCGVIESALASWVLGYVLMWVALMNLGVMPEGILSYAVPWSAVEVLVAAVICKRIL